MKWGYTLPFIVARSVPVQSFLSFPGDFDRDPMAFLSLLPLNVGIGWLHKFEAIKAKTQLPVGQYGRTAV